MKADSPLSRRSVSKLESSEGQQSSPKARAASPSASPELPIGVFDSGVGGLTVVRALRQVLPHEDICYLGDTARVPYGTKSPSTVVRFACEDTQFLVRHGVKAVVVACNTCSAWALPMLEHRFPVPVFGVIQPGVEAALERTRFQRIGIIGTAATVRSQAYDRGLLALCPGVRIVSRATPLLVPLVEEGWGRDAITRSVLEKYLTPLVRRRIDTLILGCTHYPLLKPAIRAIAGPKVSLVDSADACAHYVRRHLAAMNLLSSRRRIGALQSFVTDEAERFTLISRRFLGADIGPPWRVELAPV